MPIPDQLPPELILPSARDLDDSVEVMKSLLQYENRSHSPEAARGTARQTMPWALSKAEKKNYNDIFRNWDAQNTGFISGHTALEVFGASGLPKDDLERIWYVCTVGHVPRLISQKDIG
jgi:hypothetical protein